MTPGPWRLALPGRTLQIEPGRPLVMGIVNAGPDSFSDTVRLESLEAQVEHGLRLVDEGADVVDVGGESGVTYTGVTGEEVERDRVVPLVRRLAAAGVTVSVDTFKPSVARAALVAGAQIVNDVSGLHDPRLADEAAAAGAALVVMHTRAAPKRESLVDYAGDVVGDVLSFLAERCALACERGVARDALIVDPGPDFAKRPVESVEALRSLPRLHALGRPVLLAVSRKYFLGAITGRGPADRLAATLAAVGHGVDAGAAIVRVHDVAATVDFLRTRRVLAGHEPVPPHDPEEERLKWIRAGPSPDDDARDR
jgi:dihydropteroate synthase